MPAKPHVIVVGAGIIGASIAWHLTRKGAAVTIIGEKLGGVATPCSFAWINASWGNPEFYFHFRRRAMAEWKRLVRELPDLPLVWCGGLCWDMPPADLEAYADEHGRWGYGIRRLNREESALLEPRLTEYPDFALHVAEEGAVEPVAAARLLLADAEAHGAKFITATVSGLLQSGGQIVGAVTSEGVFAADHVALAAGAGTVPIAASAGITLQLSTPAGLIVHSHPVSKRLNGLVITPRLHMRQTAEGRIIAGTDFGGGDPGEDHQASAAELFARMKALIIDNDDLRLDFFTVGYRPTPSDGFPIVGNAGLPGLYAAVMHSGVTLAPLAGLLAADELLSGKSDESLAPFRLQRFAGARQSIGKN
ncbi:MULTISPECIES: FAD-dependent oxidoreductase [unclassified Rhizobium]|uniref:NAD(P)/FAD-dependent oxidoreductase n=1 Tax=unclassified Rhizobium TaxID=2613769 RepID=UPI00104B04BA|nr:MULTISPECIES: FAD-dependent oxidoreductase [unclassified Rhizobium]TCS00799.1 glycine/D-amino acid oxidase-like deaminating enzyme [Rhizobium sp. BK418]